MPPDRADPPHAAAAGIFVLHERLPRLRAHAETSHTEHGLTYLVDGWFRMEHGSVVRVEPGTLTLVPAGVPHRPMEGRNLEYWMAGFCASCVELDEAQPLMAPFRSVRHGAFPVIEVPRGRRRRVLRLFRELREECERGAPESPDLARALLALLLGEVRRAQPSKAAPAPTGSLVADAMAYIQQHGLDPISLKDVAAAVHRAPAHVAATVKAATGYSVGEWINAGRISEAANRLAHTDDTLDQITLHVGWRDKTHLIRQFRKVHGKTPAAWRRQHRARHL